MYHYTIIGQNGVSSLDNIVIINLLSNKLKNTHLLHTLGNSEIECAGLFNLKKENYKIIAPWENFNNHKDLEKINKNEVKELEKTYERVYNNLSDSDKNMLSCLIKSLISEEHKSSFIVVENKNNFLIKKAIEIASQENIEIFDLSVKDNLNRIKKKIIKNDSQFEIEKQKFLVKIGKKPYKNIINKLTG